MAEHILRLITEEAQDVKFISEESEGKKKYFIEGIMMVAENVNKNGRVYLQETLSKECKRYMTEMVAARRSMGELGHPQGAQVNLDRVSHVVTELRESGNNFWGRAQVLDTPYGKIVQSLLEGEIQLGVSTRGMGSLVPKNGYQEVQSDFRLAAIDVVADPSAPGAWVQGIYEGAGFIYADGVYKEVDIKNYRNKIDEGYRQRLSKKESEKFLLEQMTRYLRKL